MNSEEYIFNQFVKSLNDENEITLEEYRLLPMYSAQLGINRKAEALELLDKKLQEHGLDERLPEAISAIGGQEAIDVLHRHVEDNWSVMMKAALVIALNNLGEDVSDHLVSLYTPNTPPSVRSKLAGHIDFQGDALLDFFVNEEDKTVRYNGYAGILTRHRLEIVSNHPPGKMSMIGMRLLSPLSFIRQGAAQELAGILDGRARGLNYAQLDLALEPISDAVNNARQELCKGVAVPHFNIFSKSEQRWLFELCLGLLHNGFPSVIDAMSRLSDPRCLPALEKFASISEGIIKTNSLKAIQKINHQNVPTNKSQISYDQDFRGETLINFFVNEEDKKTRFNAYKKILERHNLKAASEFQGSKLTYIKLRLISPLAIVRLGAAQELSQLLDEKDKGLNLEQLGLIQVNISDQAVSAENYLRTRRGVEPAILNSLRSLERQRISELCLGLLHRGQMPILNALVALGDARALPVLEALTSASGFDAEDILLARKMLRL